MKKFLLVPVLGFFGLGAVSVGYAMAGIVLATLLLAIISVPILVAFKRFAPRRYERLQGARPIW